MADLTDMSQAVLFALDRRYRTREDLADRARRGGIPNSGFRWNGTLEGLGQTMGTLVRKGLAEKTKISGKMHFQLTDKGAVTQRTYMNAGKAK